MTAPAARRAAAAPRLTSLALPVLIGVVAVVAAALVWYGVAHHTGLARDDLAATHWAVAHRTAPVSVVMRTATRLAGTAGSVALAVLLALWLRRRTRAWAWPAILLGAMAAQALLAAGLKILTARPRPPLALELGAPARTFAFPSGHTLAGGTLALTVALAVAATTAHRLVRVLAGAVAVGAMALVAASRIYLGYHWLTDVVASGLLAVAITALCAVLAAMLPGTRSVLLPATRANSPAMAGPLGATAGAELERDQSGHAEDHEEERPREDLGSP